VAHGDFNNILYIGLVAAIVLVAGFVTALWMQSQRIARERYNFALSVGCLRDLAACVIGKLPGLAGCIRNGGQPVVGVVGVLRHAAGAIGD